MKPKTKKFLTVVLYACLILCLLLAAFGWWLYQGQLTSAKQKIFQAMPLPMAVVDSHFISVRDYLRRCHLAAVLAARQANGGCSSDKSAIFQQLVEERENQDLAGSLGVYVSQQQLNESFADIASHTDLRGYKNFGSLLQSYGLDETSYKLDVIKPQLLLINLQIWFSSQESLNVEAYNLAKNLVFRIQQGENMAALAQTYTQDQTGQNVSGDLGFVDPSALVQELREPVESLKIGDIALAASRYGLHVLKLEGKNGNLVHLRQIFVKTDDFQTWLNQQRQNYKLVKLINI